MHNLEVFLDKSEKLKKEIGASIKSCWFRGQSNPWPLNCSLARYCSEIKTESESKKLPSDQIIEESLYCDFVYQNSPNGSNYLSSWETLASMQHYGVPTRLLDWTESFLVACYFALEYAFDVKSGMIRDGYDPMVYFLNPYRISESSIRSDCSTLPQTFFKDPSKIWNVTLNKELDYYENVATLKSWHFESPLPIYPPRNNDRIVAQQGCFTFHGTSMEPLDHQKPARYALKSISIREYRVARELWKIIQMHNVTEYYIYRDLDRLGSHLRSRHRPMPNKSMLSTPKNSAADG